MKFTYSWLKEHLETEHQYNEVVDKLTAIGRECSRYRLSL